MISLRVKYYKCYISELVLLIYYYRRWRWIQFIASITIHHDFHPI